MIIIKCNIGQFEQELNYIIGYIFGNVFGFDYQIESSFDDDIIIISSDWTGQLVLPNIFFKNLNENWLTELSLPYLPLEIWDSNELSGEILLFNNKLPVIYGKRVTNVINDNARICLPIDIFGSAFFMLSRYEELVNVDNLDCHKRYIATNSISYKANFLHRPIIDEYIEVLWVAILKLWPNLNRKPKINKLNVTCDVDSLFDLGTSLSSIPRGFIGDVFKRKNLSLATENLIKRLNYLCGSFKRSEHYKNIQWIMDVNEKAGNSVIFYFIAGGENRLDSDYKLGSKAVRSLLREIKQRGHEVGLHPSYDTYADFSKLSKELKNFIKILNEEGFENRTIKSRQHYLRFCASSSALNLDSHRIYSDSTLSYAEVTGFRCGTSKSFPMYDLKSRKTLDIIQVPLTIMETTVISQEYMGLGFSEDALNHILKHKETSMRISGQFTFLWHNSSFEDDYAYVMYQEIIKN